MKIEKMNTKQRLALKLAYEVAGEFGKPKVFVTQGKVTRKDPNLAEYQFPTWDIRQKRIIGSDLLLRLFSPDEIGTLHFSSFEMGVVWGMDSCSQITHYVPGTQKIPEDVQRFLKDEGIEKYLPGR